jgi:hypothetical protein
MIDEEMGMPAKRELTMRQLRYLLRLRHEGVSAREIGRRLGVARSTIQDNLTRVVAAGLQWPLPEDVTDDIRLILLYRRHGCDLVSFDGIARCGVTPRLAWSASSFSDIALLRCAEGRRRALQLPRRYRWGNPNHGMFLADRRPHLRVRRDAGHHPSGVPGGVDPLENLQRRLDATTGTK